jgi:hypothetical protein
LFQADVLEGAGGPDQEEPAAVAGGAAVPDADQLQEHVRAGGVRPADVRLRGGRRHHRQVHSVFIYIFIFIYVFIFIHIHIHLHSAFIYIQYVFIYIVHSVHNSTRGTYVQNVKIHFGRNVSEHLFKNHFNFLTWRGSISRPKTPQAETTPIHVALLDQFLFYNFGQIVAFLNAFFPTILDISSYKSRAALFMNFYLPLIPFCP